MSVLTSCGVKSYIFENKKLHKNINVSCFAGLSHDLNKIVYIEDFRRPETEEYIPLLLQIINKITPCKLVTFEKKEYISFQMFDNYDRSLILLNFIRYLWFHQVGFSYKDFFTHIKKSTYKDPLKRLLASNKKACGKTMLKNHSNCANAPLLKIKGVEELMAFKGDKCDLRATFNFLTK